MQCIIKTNYKTIIDLPVTRTADFTFLRGKHVTRRPSNRTPKTQLHAWNKQHHHPFFLFLSKVSLESFSRKTINRLGVNSPKWNYHPTPSVGFAVIYSWIQRRSYPSPSTSLEYNYFLSWLEHDSRLKKWVAIIRVALFGSWLACMF